jgi:hypothetical protein
MMEWTWGGTDQIASIHLQNRTKPYQEKREQRPQFTRISAIYLLEMDD